MKYLVIIIATGMLFFSNLVFAQNIDTDAPNYVSPSPKAASLGKFGEIPVNYTAGTMATGIPLFSLQEQGIGLEVSANYFYTGYRPTEGESELGYGWRLQAGGAITRVVHGNSDEDSKGFLQTGAALGSVTTEQQRRDLANQEIDGEPDVFSFNFMGYSGKFFFGNDGNIHFVNKQPFDITFTYVLNDPDYPINGNAFGSFTITTGDGTKYIFSDYEASYASGPSNVGHFFLPKINAWYLSKVIGTKGEELIFRYQRQPTTKFRVNFSRSEKRIVIPNQPSSGGGIVTQKNFSLETYLSEIEGTLWKLEFDYSEHSESLFNETTYRKVLDEIKLIDKTQTGMPVKKSWSFGYTNSKRLLKTIQERDISGNSLPPYSFLYHAENVTIYTPQYQIIDLWGYLNNAFNQNTTLIIEAGANRNTALDQSRIFSLQKITYPTKAETLFEYEQNDASFLVGNGYTKILTSTEYYTFIWKFISGSWQLTSPNVNIIIDEASTYSSVITPRPDLDQIHCRDKPDEPLPARTAPYTAADFAPGVTCFDLLDDETLDFVVDVELIRNTTVGYGSSNSQKIPVGGVRIKKITYESGEANYSSDVVYEYVYERFDEPGVSSGQLVAEMLTEYNLQISYYNGQTFPGILSRSAPFSTMALTPVQYDQVLEKKNGVPYRKHYFTAHKSPLFGIDEFGDFVNTTGVGSPLIMPQEFGEYDSFDFLRGLSYKTESFDNTVLTARTETSYKAKSALLTEAGVYRATAYYPELLFYDVANEPVITLKKYNISSTWPRKISETETLYSLTDAAPISNVTTYEYGNLNHLQLTKTTTINSNGEEQDILVKYPLDYAGSVHVSLQHMKDNNYVTYPIEVQKLYRKNSSVSSEVVDGQVMTYQLKPITGGLLPTLVLPYKSYGLNTQVSPSAYVPYSPASNENTSTAYRLFNHYKRYNERGNPEEVQYRGYMDFAFLWGYQDQRLLASLQNATYADLNAAVTGISESIPSMLSLTDPITIKTKLAALQGQGILTNAHLTYQSFDPIFGVLDTTQPNGVRSSFTYDPFGRLSLIKDHNGHIIERYQYFHKQ